MASAATPDGTRRFRDRHVGRVPASHFRIAAGGLSVGSLGIGTYLGEPDAETDAAYVDAVRTAFRLGTNLVDTAINYRAQRSERAVGQALAAAIAAGEVARDEIVICTKGGYLPFDGHYPSDPSRWFYEAYVKSGLLAPADIVAGGHSIAPAWLAHQIDRSRANLGVDTIDVYYLHNPESQLASVARPDVMRRIGRAFVVLEEAVAAGKIGCWGVATWNGLRVARAAREYLGVADLVRIAEREVGRDHHFRAVQLPCNLGMTEAVTERSQVVGDGVGSLVEAADHHGLTVIASASLLQGKLVRALPDLLARVFAGCHTDAQRALQFVRSSPGVTTALAGMRSRAHVEENLALAAVAPADDDTYVQLFDGSA